MSQTADDPTMEATPRRQQDARREGRVPRSSTLSSTIIVVGGIAVLLAFGGSTAETIVDQFRLDLGGQPAVSLDRDTAATHWQQTIFATLGGLLPLLIGFLCVAVLGSLVQTGFLFFPKNVVPDFARVNPLGGVRRIFSRTNLVSVLIGLLQLFVAGLIVWWCLHADLASLLALPARDAGGIAQSGGHILLAVTLKVGLGLFATALLDYAYRRWDHQRELRMTPQQLREELRMIEGDPQLASRRRQMYARPGRTATDAKLDSTDELGSTNNF